MPADFWASSGYHLLRRNDEGRLTGLVITMPQLGLIPPGAWTVSITGYGEAEPVTAPEAADVVDEDDSYYELVNK